MIPATSVRLVVARTLLWIQAAGAHIARVDEADDREIPVGVMVVVSNRHSKAQQTRKASLR